MAGLDKRPRQPPIVRRLSFLNCLSAQWKQSRQAAVAFFSAVSATDLVSRMQTSAWAIFRFICMNKCDTYVHTRKEA